MMKGAGKYDARYLAFLEAISQLRPQLHRYCARMTGSITDGEDVVQDALFRAYRSLDTYDDRRALAPWLFRIAHNEAFSLLRKRRPETELEGDLPPDLTPRMLPVEVRIAVETAIGKLSPDQREAVVLKVYQGFKFEEIAEVLDCPVSTVKSRVYTALDLLKDALAPINARGGG